MSGWFGLLVGCFVALVWLNSVAYLVETSGDHRQQAQGVGSLAFCASLVLVPVGRAAGFLVTRCLGRGGSDGGRA